MYEKQTWNTGDVITEEKLNHIEDGIATGGGIYTYGEVPLFDGEVTTVSDDSPYAGGEITLQGNLPKSDISVTFNGQDYTLPHGYTEGLSEYWGELDSNSMSSFTNFPVFVYDGGIYTPEAGTYALKINETVEKFTVNDGFKSALGNILIATLDPNTGELNKMFKEIKDAYNTGLVIIKATSEEPGDLTEVVAFVSVSELEFAAIGYDFSSGKVGIFNYSAATLNSYPIAQHS